MAKALALFSGGLDSSLAVRMVQEQNVEVEGIHFFSVFTTKGIRAEPDPLTRRAAEELGLCVRFEDNSEAFLDMVKHPKHGYGSHVNPCIDCRISNLMRAAEVMRGIGADFLVTGEVVGERPMSQNRNTLRHIEKETGLNGLILRPLSALLLEPTHPEKQGWVRREDLLSVSGRSRKPQLALAARFGLKHFSTPAGGCLLTDPGFSVRMRDLLDHCPACDLNDVNLLKVGRHFRLAPDVKAVVGRNERENEAVERLAHDSDILMEATTHPGPVTLVRGPATETHLRLAASVTIRYGKAAALPRTSIRTWTPADRKGRPAAFQAAAATPELLDELRIAASDAPHKNRPRKAE